MSKLTAEQIEKRNEELRLEALRDLRILDTPGEREFDDLVRIAAEICGTPLASITLVDAERLWFKSKRGFEGTEAPRQGSLCTEAIRQDDLFVVPDISEDARFSCLPFVEQSRTRFYAATTLLASSGHALGTLCVLDLKPRELAPSQLEALKSLGRQVVAQIEMRKTISDLRVSQVQLEKLSHEAMQSRDAKSTFLANMSHEIRTPMNAIIGLTDLLLDSQLSDEQHSQVSILKNSGGTLLRLINDILDFSKLEAKKVELERVHFGPRATIEEAVALYQTLAAAKGLRLYSSSTIPEHYAVRADVHRLKQIMNNLISNALKFTARGEVEVISRLIEREDGTGDLCIAVRDSGIGISKEGCEKLFHSFTQADVTTARQFGGTGLGLSISQALCRLMGGDISVSSVVEQGSTFSFSIRIELAEALQLLPAARSRETAPLNSVSGTRVLVAEDNSTNQIVIKSMLSRLGCETVVVVNGLEALEALHREKFDLVLMDGHMPVMTGYEATERIVAEIPAEIRPPIIALTASARVEDRARCLAIGMTDYLAKPVKAHALREIIERYGKVTVAAKAA